jgi:hypothetical protein
VGQGFGGALAHRLGRGTEARAQPAQGIGDAQHDGIAQLLGYLDRLGYRGCHGTVGRLDPQRRQPVDEQRTVLGLPDGLDGGAQHLDAVARKHPVLRQGQATVQRCLAAKPEQEAIRAFLRNHPLDTGGRHRQEIDLVGEGVRGLDGGDIGVDKHSGNPLVLEGFDGLTARVVKLAGFADLERATAQDEDFVRGVRCHSMAPKRSKSPWVSTGPGAASG